MSIYTDNVNNFVLEFTKQISEFDKKQFKSNVLYLTEGIQQKLVDMAIRPDLYSKYIDNAISNLQSVGNNIDTMDDFFSKVYKSVSLEDKNITIPLQNDDIEKIRPDYLNMFVSELDNGIRKIIAGTMNDIDVRKEYISGKFMFNMKKRLVKTKLVTNDVRDLLVMDSPSMVKVDNIFIQNNTIPFLRSYKQESKELCNKAINAKSIINSASASFNQLIAAAYESKKSGKVDVPTARTLDIFIYNLTRQFINATAYVSAMVIRKISLYTYNVMQYINLYNTIYNYFPEGELVLHESAIDGDLSDIDDTTLLNSILNNNLNIIIPHLQSAIGKKKMEIASYVSKKYNFRLDYTKQLNSEKYPYDIYPYVSANKSIRDIMENLHDFEKNSKRDDLIVDLLIEGSHLDETFMSKYSKTLSSIPNIKFYIDDSYKDDIEPERIILSLYNDLDHFESNMTIISGNAKRCYDYLNRLVDEYSQNVNNMDDTTFNELNTFVDSLMKNYKDYILKLTKAFLERLDNLTDALEDAEIPVTIEPEPFVPYDYSFESYLEELQDIKDEEQEIFESYLKEYNVIKNKKTRGVKVVYEDVTQTEVGDKGSTAPTVQTDANKQQNENKDNSNTNNTTTNNTTTNTNNGEKKNIVERFKEWFRGIINKFKDKSKRMTGKNNAWLAKVKDSLLSLDTTNTSITLAKYEGVTSERITSDINSAITKINSINAKNLPMELQGKKSKAELYLFNTIPEKVGKETGFSARIKSFFINGKDGKQVLSTYSGDDAKNKIEEMVRYCEEYDKLYNSVASSLDKLSEAASKKQEEILNTVGTKNVNESVLYEANGDVKQDGKKAVPSEGTDDKINTSSVITGVVRDYSGAILTVIEKKYLDYLKVLDKLAPKNEKAPEDNKQAEENK